MTETMVVRLGFSTDEDKTKLIGVKAPAAVLTDAEVADAMDEIIASGVISARAGTLTARKFARRVTTRTTALDISA